MNIRRIFAFLLFLFSTTVVHSQITAENIDLKLLEHFVKSKIDSVRKAHKCKVLANDSILYIASKHHAKYLSEIKKLSHFESDEKFKTPQNRADFYGAKNYFVGENVLSTPINNPLRSKYKQQFDGLNLEQLALSMVIGWVDSPGHYKNIITKGYQKTGVAVHIDFENQMAYAVQMFATVKYQYQFEESSKLFPYSKYNQQKLTDSFEGQSHSLLNHNHEFKVKHGNTKKCASCDSLDRKQLGTTLRIENNKFVLRIENTAAVQELLRRKKDGFAVELVSFDPYYCGNPAYYELPSRRNGQCQLNGRITKPLYRNDLFKGFKKRKRKNAFKFVSFLFSANDVPFWQRFYSYKYEKYSSEYFEIKLAKIPKDMTGVWTHNLVYLQNNHICHIDYFTDYCGELSQDTFDFKTRSPIRVDKTEIKPIATTSSKTIFYDATEGAVKKEALTEWLDSQKIAFTTIDSVHIKAYSSVEGSVKSNENYRNLRLIELNQYFTKYFNDSVFISTSESDSWDAFYKENHPQVNPLKNLKKQEVQSRLNTGLKDTLEHILSQQRKSEILIYGTKLDIESSIQQVLSEYKNTVKALSEFQAEDQQPLIQHATMLMSQLSSWVFEDKLPMNAIVSLPRNDQLDHNARFASIIVHLQFHEVDGANQNKSFFAYYEKTLTSILGSKSSYLQYNLAVKNYAKIKVNSRSLERDVLEITNELNQIDFASIKDTLLQGDIRKLQGSLLSIMLNHVWSKNPSNYRDEARKGLLFIINLYHSNSMLTDKTALRMAKLLVYYGFVPEALEILSGRHRNKTVYKYAIQLAATHPSAENYLNFREGLIYGKKLLDNDSWCNLFMNNCGIPFQVFDDESLRKYFCENCLEKNEFLNMITSPNKSTSEK